MTTKGRGWRIATPYKRGVPRKTARLYRVWGDMRLRCRAEHRKEWKHYKHISVCPEWDRSYATFRAWAVSHGYRKGLTLDRIDNNGDYCCKNCRWIPKGHQQDNTRRTIIVEYRGRRIPLPKLCRTIGADVNLVRCRVQAGWPIERAISEPRRVN